MGEVKSVLTSAEYKRLRVQLGVSQVRMAELLGLHAQTVGNRERGAGSIDTEAVYAIRYLLLSQMYDLSEIFD